MEVELAASGGTPRHYYTTFNETFIPVEGVLGVDVGRKQWRLQGKESATASVKEVRRFYNPEHTPIRFQVKIYPAENRFPESLCIGYGLADDGKTKDKGIPKKPDHLAVPMEHSDSGFTGFLALIEPLLLRRARRARRRGVMQELIKQYCK